LSGVYAEKTGLQVIYVVFKQLLWLLFKITFFYKALCVIQLKSVSDRFASFLQTYATIF